MRKSNFYFKINHLTKYCHITPNFNNVLHNLKKEKKIKIIALFLLLMKFLRIVKLIKNFSNILNKFLVFINNVFLCYKLKVIIYLTDFIILFIKIVSLYKYFRCFWTKDFRIVLENYLIYLNFKFFEGWKKWERDALFYQGGWHGESDESKCIFKCQINFYFILSYIILCFIKIMKINIQTFSSWRRIKISLPKL